MPAFSHGFGPRDQAGKNCFSIRRGHIVAASSSVTKPIPFDRVARLPHEELWAWAAGMSGDGGPLREAKNYLNRFRSTHIIPKGSVSVAAGRNGQLVRLWHAETSLGNGSEAVSLFGRFLRVSRRHE
jgi:hypothetical protein